MVNEELSDTADPERLPIVIGVGQSLSRWNGADSQNAPSPLSLSVTASREALKNTGAQSALTERLDAIASVRTLEDSIPRSPYPFGRCDNYPGAVAEALDLNISSAVYSAVGGDQPQALVNEYAAKLATGEHRAVLLCGAEATAAYKAASRGEQSLDWSSSSGSAFEDRGIGEPLSTRHERRCGLGWPTNSYPFFEEAYRTRQGLTRSAYLCEMSEMLASFSQVAAVNPYAQFPIARAVEFLQTVSSENYAIAGPYLKWHVAQDAVNQGAAVVMTTVAEARSAGVAEDRWVYLHGHSVLADSAVARRPDFSRSRSLEGAISLALAATGVSAQEIELFDIYSCFPCVVFMAAEALGLDWRQKTLTQTGGLPFFGGPGNNYSMHAIATMVERLRERRGAFGLVLANGGYLSKHAVGVYATSAPQRWQAFDGTAQQAAIDAVSRPSLDGESGSPIHGEVETFSIVYGRGGPEYATLAVRCDESRALVKIEDKRSSLLRAIVSGDDPIGSTVCLRVVSKSDASSLSATEFELLEGGENCSS